MKRRSFLGMMGIAPVAVAVGAKAAAAAPAVAAKWDAIANTTTGNFRMTTAAGPFGFRSRYAIEARVGAEGSYRAARMFIDPDGDVCRVVSEAEQFVLPEGSAPCVS